MRVFYLGLRSCLYASISLVLTQAEILIAIEPDLTYDCCSVNLSLGQGFFYSFSVISYLVHVQSVACFTFIYIYYRIPHQHPVPDLYIMGQPGSPET